MTNALGISDIFSQKITFKVGEEMAKKLKNQNFSEAINYLLNHYIIFPPNLVQMIDSLVKCKSLGYTCKEDFFYEAAIWKLKALTANIENIEVPKTLYNQLQTAITEMNLPYSSVNDFIEEQMKKLNQQYKQWKEQQQ